MRTYLPTEQFNTIVSTARTLIGADVTKFKVSYAPINDLGTVTEVSGAIVEATKTIGTAHTATANANATGKTTISVQTGHTIVAGDTIEYATGLFGYVTSTTATTISLKRTTKSAIANNFAITQSGKSGDYATPMMSIATVGEYSITIEAPSFGIITQSRIKIAEEVVQAPTTSDETISVAY